MANDLSILCVSRMDASALPFLTDMSYVAQACGAELVACCDTFRQQSDGTLEPVKALPNTRVVFVKSQGYIESVLDEALQHCGGQYVMRLDDDERCSPAMLLWLHDEEYKASDIWSFPRMHIWPDADSVLITPHLWPDAQTRLALRTLSGGRKNLHAPSPHGWGLTAPVAIEHHKFLSKSRAQREETSRLWHSGGMKVFSLPEDVLQNVTVHEKGDGTVPWEPKWKMEVEFRKLGAIVQ